MIHFPIKTKFKNYKKYKREKIDNKMKGRNSFFFLICEFASEESSRYRNQSSQRSSMGFPGGSMVKDQPAKQEIQI